MIQACIHTYVHIQNPYNLGYDVSHYSTPPSVLALIETLGPTDVAT